MQGSEKGISQNLIQRVSLEVDESRLLIRQGKLKEAHDKLKLHFSDESCTELPLEIKLMAISLHLRLAIEKGQFGEGPPILKEGEELLLKLRQSHLKLNRSDEVIAEFFYEKAIFLFLSGRYRKSLEASKEALSQLPQENMSIKTKILYAQATAHAYLGEFLQAEKLLDMIQGTTEELAPFINLLRGEIFRFRGEPNAAVPFYEKVLQLERNNKNGRLYHQTLLCLAKCWKTLENYENVSTYLSIATQDLNAENFLRFNKTLQLERADFEIDKGSLKKASLRLRDLEKELRLPLAGEPIPESTDLYMAMIVAFVKVKLLLSQNDLDRVPLYLESLYRTAKVLESPFHLHWVQLKEGQYCLTQGNYQKALDLASHALRFFELIGAQKHIVAALTLMVRAYMSLGQISQLRSLLQRKMTIEVRYAYYRSYVQSSILMAAALKSANETEQVKSILLNALKVAQRVHLSAERAVIYKLLNEEENFSREFQCLNDKDKAKVEYFFKEFNVPQIMGFELILDFNHNQVIHHQHGAISFGNKFTLLKILSILMENHGRSVTKEFLAENLWNRPYNPITDDNTIYIHINRLRKVLEVEPNQPQLILNTYNGYQLSPTIRVKILPYKGVVERDRFSKLIELFNRNEKVTSKQIQDYFHISKATAARDILRWVGTGQIKRLHIGGHFYYALATPQETSSVVH